MREVVVLPEHLSKLPAQTEGLIGAIELRDVVLPVLDLGIILGTPTQLHEGLNVAVISNGEFQIGLLVDGLNTITNVTTEQLTPITGNGLFFSHSFATDDNSVVSILDTSILLAPPGLPLTPVPVVASVVNGENFNQLRTKYTLVRCGTYVFALDVAYVHTTLPTMHPKASLLKSRLCRGVIEYMGHDIPLIDLLELLGLDNTSNQDLGPSVVIKLDEGYVALALGALSEIIEMTPDSLLAIPSVALRRPEMVEGIFDLGKQCLVLSGPALQSDIDLISYSKLNTVAANTEAVEVIAGQVQAGQGESLLRYSIGTDIVTPLDQVKEILPYPADALSLNQSSGLVGVISHRGRVLPVASLASLLGGAAAQPTEASCLLLVGEEGHEVAFVVDALRSIEPLSWRDPQFVESYFRGSWNTAN